METEICIPVHKLNDNRFEMYKRCLLANKKLPSNMKKSICVVYDNDTPEAAIKFAEQLDIKAKECPKDYKRTTGKHEFLYNDSKADYVMICQDDDIPVMNSLLIKECAIEKYVCVTNGWLCYQETDIGYIPAFYAEPHFDKQYIMTDCLPSTWYLNKHLMPKLPIYKEADRHWDIFTSVGFFRYGSICLVKMPLTVYYRHNQSASTLCPEEPCNFPDEFPEIDKKSEKNIYILKPNYFI